MRTMSQHGTDRENSLQQKREKNRIAQQRHRAKKKSNTAKMMVTLQEVKLAATKNDINRIQELVKSPFILLSTTSPSTSTTLQRSSIVDVPTAEKAFSSSQNLFEPVEWQPLPQIGNLGSLMTQDCFQSGLTPYSWDLVPFEPSSFHDVSYIFNTLPSIA